MNWHTKEKWCQIIDQFASMNLFIGLLQSLSLNNDILHKSMPHQRRHHQHETTVVHVDKFVLTLQNYRMNNTMLFLKFHKPLKKKTILCFSFSIETLTKKGINPFFLSASIRSSRICPRNEKCSSTGNWWTLTIAINPAFSTHEWA